MNAMTRGVLAVSVVAVLAGPAVSAAAMPSAATDGQVSINTGAGWTHDPATPLFDITRIVPGWTGSASLGVRNDSDGTAALSIKTTNVVEDENGCNDPESYVDTTCSGDNTGELGKEIVLSVYADPENDGSYQSSPTWRGTIEDLTHATTLDAQLAAGGTRSFKITAELPRSSGNETQSDQVSFDLQVRLDGIDAASVAVEGTKTIRTDGPGPLRHIIDALPLTGTPSERMVAAALCLLLMGTALTLGVRHRRLPDAP